MANKALGKGLSALISDTGGDQARTQTEGVAHLKTSLIRYNSQQPRTHYDDTHLEELKASIREKGILQPILIREKDGQYEVIAGERRLRAAQELNLAEVPVIIKEVSDQEALVIALVENIQREELNPIEEAEAYKRLIDDFQYTQDAVAESVGKDRSTIANFLRLLRLPERIQDSVYSGEISMGHARALLSIEDGRQQEKIFVAIREKGLSVREAENLAKAQAAGPARRKTPHPAKRHEVIALEEELQKILGTKIQIASRKKRGKIIIEYYSLDDLDRIVGILRT